MPLLEKEIEAKVREYAIKKYKAYVRKFTSPNHRSVPDRLFIFPNGQVLFIEFKRTGCKATAKQEREFERLRDVGQTVIIIDDVDEGKWTVDTFASAPVPARIF